MLQKRPRLRPALLPLDRRQAVVGDVNPALSGAWSVRVIDPSASKFFLDWDTLLPKSSGYQGCDGRYSHDQALGEMVEDPSDQSDIFARCGRCTTSAFTAPGVNGLITQRLATLH